MDGQHDCTPNRALLRELASLLTSESWVENTTVFPANRPDSIVISLERQYYPRKYVSEAYIEVQSYTTGDFHISYVEDQHGEEWICRWDDTTVKTTREIIFTHRQRPDMRTVRIGSIRPSCGR